MRAKRLSISNFKAIGARSQIIELAPITLLFGPNSAGKSTVLQGLIYLRELVLHRNHDPDRTSLGGEGLDLGGFRNLVHQHDLSNAIRISIEMDLGSDELPDYLTDQERQALYNADMEPPDSRLGQVSTVAVVLSVRWSELRDAPFIESLACDINGQFLARIGASSDGRQVILEALDPQHPIFAAEGTKSDKDGPSLGEQLLVALSPTATIAAARSFPELLASGQPFADKALEELEALCAGAASEQPELLQALAAEVGRRTSRRADVLGRRIQQKLEALKGRTPLGYLPLTIRGDALPDPRRGLGLDESVWRDDEDLDGSAVEDPAAFRLLCQGLLSGLIVGPLVVLGDWLRTFSYIGPLRDMPPRHFQPRRTLDESRWANGLAGWELLHHASERTIAEINYWLGKGCLKSGYQVVVHRYRELPAESPALVYLESEMDLDDQAALKELIEGLPVHTRVSVVEEETGLEVMPQDIGVGISQLFPVLALTVTQQTGLIAIEQPELHVHPALQVELADLFARYAIEHDKLMLLETHSEHIMLRLLRRIRERCDDEDGVPAPSTLDKESVSVTYVQSGTDGTQFKRLRVDDTGDFLDEWPQGFFEERDGELFF